MGADMLARAQSCVSMGGRRPQFHNYAVSAHGGGAALASTHALPETIYRVACTELLCESLARL